MSEFVLSCSSTADLTQEQYDAYGISYVCFNFELDDVRYSDDLGNSMAFTDFYKKMSEGAMTKTSQPNAEEYAEYFRGFLSEGKDIIHLVLSSGISGAYNSAKIAEDMVREEFPDRKITVIDSLAACGGFGLLMIMLAELRDQGKSYEELVEWAEEHRLNIHHWFFPTDLQYLVRGGRVSKVSGFVGNMLSICPLLNVDFEGKLIPRAKIRTKKKVIQETANKMMEFAENRLDYSGKCIINHSDCYEDARALADIIEANFPKLDGKVIINYIGTTIGSHTGPGTVAMFFYGDKRVD